MCMSEGRVGILVDIDKSLSEVRDPEDLSRLDSGVEEEERKEWRERFISPTSASPSAVSSR
jgi:hypothetical protein